MSPGRRDLVIALVVLAGLVVLALVAISAIGSGGAGGAGAVLRGEKVGLVEVKGPIVDAGEWVRRLDRMRRDEAIRAVVLRIESPGGAIAASEELYRAAVRARAAKPVVASMGNVAASGGYYAALGADSIVANAGTTTGSIGVLLELLEWRELMDKLGLEAEVIKSGEFKDAGNPFRELTPRERRLFQAYIDDAHEQFVQVVARERGLDEGAVRELADGRVFTGRRAHEAGLVDRIGDQYSAMMLAAELAGIEGEPRLVRPDRSRDVWLDMLLNSAVQSIRESLGGGGSVFQYKWKPENTR